MHLILENIRAFSGRHEIPVRPLTVLTGENSSGKTTFLGMFSAVCDRDSYPVHPNFSKAPYNFGNYDTIATYKGGRFGRAKHFSLGFSQQEVLGQAPGRVEARYRSYRGQVQLAKVTADASDFHLTITMPEHQVRDLVGTYTLRYETEEISGDFPLPQARDEARGFPPFALLLPPFRHAPDEVSRQRALTWVKAIDYLFHLTPAQAISIAPIRTKPERTYSQVAEAYKPTGDHIPFVLERLSRDESRSKERERVFQALRRFGEESGLFKHFTVKHLGDKASEPFQLMVNVAGRPTNLVDVGYGVSQTLPIIVESALASSGQFLLLQQPEVHLHPRAQAALGGFFARLAALGGCGLIVETHSDYIIDRIRQEVAAKTLSPGAVVVVYFHRQGFETIPHALGIDSNGNLTNVPHYYREFFLQEELNLFSRAAKS